MSESGQPTPDDHMGLLHHLVQKIHVRTNSDLEYDEMVSIGWMGLKEACENFEPERGNSFATYAAPIIRGRIIDWIRTHDTKVARWVQMHEDDVDPGVTPVHNAEHSEVLKIERYLQFYEHRIPIEKEAAKERDASRFEALIEDPRAVSELSKVEQQDLLEIVREEMESCIKPYKRKIFLLYYLEEFKQREIADMMDVTLSRISQVIKEVREKLQRRLSDRVEIAA